MLDLTIERGVACLRLARPERRNAIPLAGWSELAARARDAEAAGARLLILGGAPGGAFCSGADVSDFAAFRDDPAARTAFRLAIRAGLDAVRDLRIPSIAAVEGACYGAGVALAMACDMRIAGPDASFAITPAKLGIGYPQEDVHRLVTLVGPAQAVRLLLSAQPIGGQEAERIGLAERFVEADYEAELGALADAVTANDPASIAMLRRGISLAAEGVAQDDEQDRAFDDLLGSDALFTRLASQRKGR